MYSGAFAGTSARGEILFQDTKLFLLTEQENGITTLQLFQCYICKLADSGSAEDNGYDMVVFFN